MGGRVGGALLRAESNASRLACATVSPGICANMTAAGAINAIAHAAQNCAQPICPA
jgi:hypothetical protein